MWPVAVATEPVRAVLARATPLHGYTLRMFGVPESEIAKSLREIEADGVDVGAVEITTCLRRGEIEIDVRYRDEAAAVAEAVRGGLAERHRRHLFSLDGETIDSQVARLLAGRRLGLAESCSGGLLAARITDSAGCLRLHGRQRRRLLERGQGGAAGGGPGPDRAPGARSRPRSPRRWRSAPWSASAPTSPSRSPGSPGPRGGTEEKPVGYVCFNARLADGTAIARDPIIPGGRADIRDRSALVGMHLLRILLSGAEPPL